MTMPTIQRQRFLLHARRESYQRKLAATREIIRTMLADCYNVYVAFSTGKDSNVMLHLVWEQDPRIPALYFDADCAYPESKDLLTRMEAAGRPIIRWPCEPILDTMARCGGPTDPRSERETMNSTVYRPIRAVLDAYHFDGVFVGLRQDESRGRNQLVRARGQEFYHERDGIMECLPVARWKYDDIWAYLISNEVDYNRAYDLMWELPERERRVSYWAGETNHAFGRWAWLRKHYPHLYNEFVTRFPEVKRYT